MIGNLWLLTEEKKSSEVKQFSKDFRVCLNEFHYLDLIKKNEGLAIQTNIYSNL